MNEKYRYFIHTSWGEHTNIKCLASNEKTGIFFKWDGNPYFNVNNGFHTSYSLKSQKPEKNNYKELSLKQMLSLFTKKQQSNIKKSLGIKELENIIVSDKIKEEIINNLKEMRAFNEDSALKIEENDKNFDFYEVLAEQNIIKSFNFNKFYFFEKMV